MLRATGPVTSSKSACRGLATNLMPSPRCCRAGCSSAWISSSQPLHEPASTWRMHSARPSTLRISSCSALCARAARRRLDGAGSVTTPIEPILFSVFHMSLQIVPAVGQVERLVDQRKVRNDVADDRVLEHGPVLPRRIVRMAARDAAVARRRAARPCTGPRQPSTSPMPSAPAGGAATSARRSPAGKLRDDRRPPAVATPRARRSARRRAPRRRPRRAAACARRAPRTARTADRRAGRSPGRSRGRRGRSARAASRARASPCPASDEPVAHAGVLVVDRAHQRRLRAAIARAHGRARSRSVVRQRRARRRPARRSRADSAGRAPRRARAASSSFSRENCARPNAKPASLPSAPRSPRWFAMRSLSSASARSHAARAGTAASRDALERLAVRPRVGDRGVARHARGEPVAVAQRRLARSSRSMPLCT